MVDTSRTYTLQDIQHWQVPGTTLAVLGSPIKHSLSPLMHNAALAAMARTDPTFADWRYIKIEVLPDNLAEACQLLHSRAFAGINLTLPHKVQALQIIEGHQGEALRMGAVNTLIRTKTGYRGANTDGYGSQQAVWQEFHFNYTSGETMHLLGAGGAAQAIAVQFITEGTGTLWIGNRSGQRLENLLKLLHTIPEAKERVHGYTFDKTPQQRPPHGLIINATSQGLDPSAPAPISLDAFDPKRTWVYDTIYNPPETALLQEARKRGIPAANGLSMLVHQGAKSLQYWSGMEPPVEVMTAALNP